MRLSRDPLPGALATPRPTRPMPRCDETSGCSATVLGRVLVEQEGQEPLDEEERIRLLARSARATGSAREPAEVQRTSPVSISSGSALVLRAFSRTSSSRTSPSSTTDCGAVASTSTSSGLRASRSRGRRATRPGGRRPTPSSRTPHADVSLELVLTAHPTEATRRTRPDRAPADERLLDRLDDAIAPPGEPSVEEPSPRRSRCSGRPTRSAPQRPRVVDEIRHGLWFFEQSLFDAAPSSARDYRRASPRARCRSGSAPGSAATWTATRRPERDDRGGARARPRAALDRYRRTRSASSRQAIGSRARSSTSRRSCSRRSRATSAELPATRRDRRLNADEPYRRKLWFVWQRLENGLSRADRARHASRPTST